MNHPSPFLDHPREYHSLRYVYPVISRRSRGLSIGVNLNPDKVCNWDCPYCQVDRTTPPRTRKVDDEALIAELRLLIEDARSGLLWEHPRFRATPPELRVIRDIAFSGDGEPTSYPGFAGAARAVCALRAELGLDAVCINLLTNATLFHLPHVREGLEALAGAPGSVWCKLDAGGEAYFQKVNVSRFSLDHCLGNIAWLARQRPVTIQSLFMRYDGAGPDDAELGRYVAHIRRILDGGGAIEVVQVYTVARRPADPRCAALDPSELEAIASRLRAACPGLAVDTFPGG